ncbi:hypothetical protein BpHYR1_052444 [Brachionus plicatilis]|uniref:Uncharacterized protein n=1 Tax=Brachionus plicatilis TaxID=10195 RepID=A0A3M7QZ90_BRAPC|nr:hypothetical protein BpHYR1_052444 [Brachionus plicatilis]
MSIFCTVLELLVIKYCQTRLKILNRTNLETRLTSGDLIQILIRYQSVNLCGGIFKKKDIQESLPETS